MIVAWKGTIPPGQVCDEPIITHDLYKTFLGAAGVEKLPDGVQGANWLSHIGGEKVPWPQRPLFWTVGAKNVKWAVRDQRWKLINDDISKERYAWPNVESRERLNPVFRTQLFDLAADPMETTDLSEKYPEVVERLQKAMDDFHAQCPPSLATPEVLADIQEKLKTRKENPDKYPEAYRIDGAPGHERSPHKILFGAE
jgi:arylsulfatase A-like enzyme